MVLPAPRNPVGMLWFNEGCQNGCPKCVGYVNPFIGALFPYAYCFYGRMEPTLNDRELITYPEGSYTSHNPWRAPGFSPVVSPCGLAGGSDTEHPENGGVPPPGFKAGFDGRDLPQLPGRTVDWAPGSTQEVSWQISANHGGGYSYRLCPASGKLTEECFQRHHLKFAGESSWIQFGSDPRHRIKILANRTAQGTRPAGSQWTKVPIPSCSGPGGGYTCKGCERPQFASPIPGLWGNGPSNGCVGCNPNNKTQTRETCGKVMDFSIVDLVEVPELPAGHYVLSFRWDCEQTPQIWTQCADVKVTSRSDSLRTVV